MCIFLVKSYDLGDAFAKLGCVYRLSIIIYSGENIIYSSEKVSQKGAFLRLVKYSTTKLGHYLWFKYISTIKLMRAKLAPPNSEFNAQDIKRVIVLSAFSFSEQLK